MELFDPKLGDNDYRYLRNNSALEWVRDAIEDMWTDYQPFADENFGSEFAKNFYNRFWEMYITCAFLKLGFKIVPRNARGKGGPDICIIVARGQKVWVEAVAPSAGEGADMVPSLRPEQMGFRVPDDNIVLRLRQGIEDKFRQYLQYIDEGLVNATEPYIIAVYGGRIPFHQFDDDIPYIILPLFPIGPYSFTYSRDSGEKIGEGYPYRPAITKESGSDVAMDVFCSEKYGGISAVIYSDIDYRAVLSPPGNNLTMIYNPLAHNPLPEHWLPNIQEYWAEGGQLRSNKSKKL